ncbi:MAG: ACP S-malonyltransferase [Actinophytocola sp.]|nr:ACP S-malonyltransferase [Actinophytocola sp.]
MFSGQGSQYYGMGRELYSSSPVFARKMRSLSGLFAGFGLPDLVAEIYREDRTSAHVFDRFDHTHPAILMIELSLVELLRSEGIEPEYVLGASLGEFAAATVAGVLDVEELAYSIAEQVRLVERHCPEGRMISVLDRVDDYRVQGRSGQMASDQAVPGELELAAVYSDEHFVLSGSPAEVARQEKILRGRGVVCQRLPVRYPFHSPLMDVAAEPYGAALSGLSIRQPRIPFVSCATGDRLDTVQRQHFWRMVRDPIDFRQAIRRLEDCEEPMLYLDIGASSTMANFAGRNVLPGSGSRAMGLIDPFFGRGKETEKIRELRKQFGRNRRPVRSKPSGVRMKAVVFPGQGAHSRGMGSGLFERFPDLVSIADQILGYSIAELCSADPDGRLDNTEFTQPAIYAVSVLAYLAAAEDDRPGADYFAGHSLGEYAALFAAGAFDFGTGLRLVRERGRLMGQMVDGGMAAVIGLDEEAVRRLLDEHGLTELDVANYNAPDQLVLSGPRDLVREARETFTEAGARGYVPLRVGGAFHSRYMEPARRDFDRFLETVTFGSLSVPVIANVTGREYDESDIRRLLGEQLVRPVRWEQSVRHLLASGVTDFAEVGPGSALTKMIDNIRRAAPDVPVQPTPVQPESKTGGLDPRSLGSSTFRQTYRTRYAYVCGSMYRGIASTDLVVRAARAGLLAFFGSGGLAPAAIASAIDEIHARLPSTAPVGVNLVHNPTFPSAEDETVDVLLARGVRTMEASAFMNITPALVRYRLNGLTKGTDGEVRIANRILAKVSRPEVAESFLCPPPDRLVGQLEQQGVVTPEQAALAARVPMADDLCVEADSGGHTDRGSLLVLFPTMVRLRDRMVDQYGYPTPIGVGAAGGIGTPEAAAAGFLLGADFVLTGSINQCTVEAGMSDLAKDLLAQINVQDTDYAPAGDMFELGAQVQVLKRGVFFPARARKLYELYRRHESLDEIPQDTRSLIERRYFHRTFDEVWQETKEYFADRAPQEIEQAEDNPKYKMALVFRWYFGHSQRAAMAGSADSRVDFQIHCGPALGSFNQWVKGTPLEDWRQRHVDEIGIRLMAATANLLERRLSIVGGSA